MAPVRALPSVLSENPLPKKSPMIICNMSLARPRIEAGETVGCEDGPQLGLIDG